VIDVFLIAIFLVEHFIFWGRSCGWGEHSIFGGASEDGGILSYGGAYEDGGGFEGILPLCLMPLYFISFYSPVIFFLSNLPFFI